MHKLANRKIQIGVALAIILLAGLWWYLAHQDGSEYTTIRTVRYSYTLHNPKAELLRDVSFYTYLPVSSSSHFTPGETRSNAEYQIKTDTHGNRLMVFELGEFPPLSSKVISVTTKVNIHKEPLEQDIDNVKQYLAAEKYVELEAAELKSLADRLRKAERVDSAQQQFNWVSRNINYQGYVSQDKGALQAFRTRQGDCTEYMYLFTALSRLTEVPTRNVGGFVVSEDSLLRAEDFHNWSEIYLDGKWRVVDPQNRQFLEAESAYIGMRIIADQDSTQPSPFNSHRFFVSNRNIQVTMN